MTKRATLLILCFVAATLFAEEKPAGEQPALRSILKQPAPAAPTPSEASEPAEPAELPDFGDAAPLQPVDDAGLELSPVPAEAAAPAVQQATFVDTTPVDDTTPVVDTTPQTPAEQPSETSARPLSTADELLKTLREPPAEIALDGEPLTLQDAVSGLNDPRAIVQKSIVQKYWSALFAEAEYYDVLRAAELLEGAPAPQAEPTAALLSSLQADAQARVAETKVALVAARYELADATGRETPQRPSSDPFLGAYRTSFETLFANRTPPSGLRKLDAAFPLHRELIDARAEAVTRSRAALRQTQQAFANGEADLTDVLSRHAEHRIQVRQFLSAARNYNWSIAEYALAVAGPGVNSETLVGMLIEVQPTTRSVLIRGQGPDDGEQPAMPDPFVKEPTLQPIPQSSPVLVRPGQFFAPTPAVRPALPTPTGLFPAFRRR